MSSPLSLIESLIDEDMLRRLEGLAASAPPGHFAEIGVYKGGSAYRLYQVAEQQGRTLYLYDTFAGHTVVDQEKDVPRAHWLGRYADNAEHLEALKQLMPNAVFCVGTFPDTLVPMAPLAFVHGDCDLYHPTTAICELLPPMMVPGGILLFDDYSCTDCRGVKEAVDTAFGVGECLSDGRRMVRIT